jgi:hypothetical protein
MEHVYKHASGSRAKAVLKALMEVLNENGVDYDTPTTKHTVARLYGYGSWNAMMHDVGVADVNGPEDYELSKMDQVSRRAFQVQVLVESGLTRGFADYLLSRLKPTSRASGNTLTADGHWDFNGPPSRYHPLRLLDCYRRFDELFIQQGKPTEELYDVVKAYRTWLDGQDKTSLNALDLLSITVQDLISQLQARSSHDLSYIIDATRCSPPEYSFKELAANAPQYSRSRVHYIHFGTNAFPSPFSDAGIEGAYIELKYNYEPDQIFSNAVQILFVCSDSSECGPTASPELSLMSLLRGYFFSYDAETNGPFHPLWAYEKSSSHADRDLTCDPWPAFIREPLYAGLSALKAFHDRSVSITDRICGDIPLTTRRAITRAVGENRIFEAVDYLDEKGALVRVLGGEPEGTVRQLPVASA